MKRIKNIVQLGETRLERARKGENFFQNIPQAVVTTDILPWYLANFGHIINTDCAKMAFIEDGYTPSDPISVAKFHPQSSSIVQQLVNQMLSEVDHNSVVLFMAGGNGAGKSTFCNGARRGLTKKDWILDATLASYEPAAQTMISCAKKELVLRLFLLIAQKQMLGSMVCKNAQRMVHIKRHAMCLR